MRVPYTRASVERALDIHAAGNRIKLWRSIPPPLTRPPTSARQRDRTRWYVLLNDGHALDLRSLREAYVFVAGLGSAAKKARMK